MSTPLETFVRHAQEKGMDAATIRMLLVSSGWKEKDVIQQLADANLKMPIPAPPDRGGAQEAFFHLLTFAAFYTSIVSLVLLLFHAIHRWVPDAAHPPTDDRSAIRWAIAFLVVAFPAFFTFSWMVIRQIRSDPERSWSATRRWLTYLTLLLAAVALGGDLIALIVCLLEGELTLRFLLKVGVVLLLAGFTFAYFLFSLRADPTAAQTTTTYRRFAAIGVGLVLFSLVSGFVLAGSPGAARLERIDERRVGDLRQIHGGLANHTLGATRYEPYADRELTRPLPETLDELLETRLEVRPDVRDPVTGELYDYRILGESRFELCATFDRARDRDRDGRWNHPAGRHCFEFDLLRD